jgi:hypothetical protein
MTRNTDYLADTLSRRIAHRETSSNDLALLRQLLVCLQVRWLLLGSAMGAGAAICVQTALFAAGILH